PLPRPDRCHPVAEVGLVSWPLDDGYLRGTTQLDLDPVDHQPNQVRRRLRGLSPEEDARSVFWPASPRADRLAAARALGPPVQPGLPRYLRGKGADALFLRGRMARVHCVLHAQRLRGPSAAPVAPAS